MVAFKHLLVILVWLQAAAINSSISSEHACEGHDGVAYLQRFEKDSSASLAALETLGNCFDIENGDCIGNSGGNAKCTVCDPDDGTNETIPSTTSTVTRFPSGKLECSPNTQCKSANSPSSGEYFDFFTFKNANDYQVCAGKDTCKNSWRIKNVGSVCCSGSKSCDTSFVAEFGSSVDDGSTGTCIPDACCDGEGVCVGTSATGSGVPSTQFIGGRSLSCRGKGSCVQIWATLGKDLYCSEFSGVGQTGDTVCASSSNVFDFENVMGSEHCVSCLGTDSKGIICSDSTYNFNTVNAQVKMILNAKNAGKKSKVNMASTGCIEINCVAGTDTCTDMVLTLNSATCHCTGSEALCNTISGNKASSPTGDACDYTDDSNPCSFEATMCSDPSTCCDGLSATADAGTSTDPPECGNNNCKCQAPPPDVSTSTGQITGDPHIDTFDGQHYLLLRQGSFSFWRFSGSDAEIFSAKNHALLKKLPVDFKIYAHYSGHKSYTKGLLLVDSSGATTPQRVLELTSEDCTWRTKTKDTEWSAVEKPQLLSLPDADGDEMTAFRIHEQEMYVELLMKKADGAFKKIGNLYVRCKPGYHINTKISMSSKEDIGLVQGQVGVQGHTAAGEDHKASFLQGGLRMRSDSEFVTSEKWTDLGGSAAAETYLSEVDEEGAGAFLKDCSGQEKIEAEAMCKKYLGEPPARSADLHSFENRFDNCVFDVCNGGGEIAAELAAEIFHAE